MRSVSRLLADTLAKRSPVRYEVSSIGMSFYVSAWPRFTVLDAICPGMRYVRKVNRLHPAMQQHKKLLYDLRCESLSDGQKSELTQVMPQVVAYVSSLNGKRASTRKTRAFVVHL